MAAHPLAYNPDGTAVDPIAFRDALMADPEKLRAIEADKELAAALLGDDTAKIQDTLKMIFEAQKREAGTESLTVGRDRFFCALANVVARLATLHTEKTKCPETK